VLVDASTVCAPGNTGTDWRIHLGFDLAAFRISDVKLTDVRGGETLKRYSVSPGDVVVGDRGYSRRTDLASVTQKQGDFIVRLNWACVPLTDQCGEPFDIVAAVHGIPEAAVREFNLRLKPGPKRNVPALPVRVVAVRKSEAAAAVARKKILAMASKKQTTPDPRTLEMAAYVVVITSLASSRLAAADVLEVYRFRWQVELVFKRMKGLLDLDGLPAKDLDLARTFIYSKVLAALLLDDFSQAFVSFSPWGFIIK
jgi:IS4 transposase